MLKAARPLLVHTRWAQVRDIPRNGSLVIKFRRYTLLSAATTALSEGVTPSGSQLAVTDVTATVNKAAVEKSFLIPQFSLSLAAL
jgi:N4-gp56 family major capsid protein